MSKRFAIPLILIIAGGLLGAGQPMDAVSAQQETPPAADAPNPRLTYDGILDMPHLPPIGDATAQEATPVLLPAQYASWSRLVFQSARNGHDWEVYTAAGDGSGQANLSNHSSMDMHPRLNRGATRVVFASDRQGNYEIFAMNPDGGGQSQLTYSAKDDVDPAWSPDGSRIAFQSYRDGQAEIYVMKADGDKQIRLTNHGDYDGEPAWSPDGSQIAFTRRFDNKYRIWVMNADGSNPRQLSNQPSSENPIWSPDGAQIAYDADGNGDGWQELWLMDAAGGNQHQAYQPPEYNTDTWAGSWSPDGRYVAFTRISFLQQDGNWYWTTAYLDAWDSANSGNIMRLSSNGEDWNPDWQTLDTQAPVSSIQTLPAQSPAPFAVSWSGTDIGPAGIAGYDVQVKDGPGGAWTDWQFGTPDQSAAYPGNGGHTYYFRSRARDRAGNIEPWPADPGAFTTVEGLPPQTAMATLPAYSRNGAALRWGGTDPGGSGIRGYDVQFRQGNGAWTDWLMGATDTSATFTGSPGEDYGFRVRGVDKAWNREAWPAGDAADTSTTLYAWRLTGRLTDNRGIAVGRAPLGITPSPLLSTQTDVEGSYLAYLTANGDHTLTVSRPGYGQLDAPGLDKDGNLDLYLPPAQNLVTNGSFEAGTLLPAGWMVDGRKDAAAVSEDSHTGARAVLLGQACPDPCIAGPTSLNTEASSADMAGDSEGNLYLLWAGYNGAIPMARLATKLPGGVWSAPEDLGQRDSNSTQVGIAVDGLDVVHAVWSQDDGLYYRQRAPGAQWSPAQRLIPNGTDVDIAADYRGGVHIIYYIWDPTSFASSIRYLERLPSGHWQAPITLDTGYHRPGIAVGPDASVHFIYQKISEGIVYRWRPHGGVILPAEKLWTDNGYSFYPQRLAVSGDGTVHAIFHWGWSSHYLYRPPGRPWSTPESSDGTGTPAMAVDSKGILHIAGLNGYGPYSLYYRTRSTDGRWGVPITLGGSYTYESALVIDPQDEVHLAGYLMDQTPGLYYWTSLAAAPSDSFTITVSQQVTIPADLHRPTLSANYRLIGQGNPLSIQLGNAISATEVFSASASSTWQLAHADLSPWSGQQVTVTFLLRQTAGTPYARVWLDDVTLGDWPTPVISSVDPPRAEAWTATPIVIHGTNFISTPGVRVGAVEASGITWIDEHTLHAIVPATLPPGRHDIWITNPGGATSTLVGAFRSGKVWYLPSVSR